MCKLDTNTYTKYEVHYLTKENKWGICTRYDAVDATDTLNCLWSEWAQGKDHMTQMRFMGNFYIDETRTTMYECIEMYQLLPEE